MDPHLLGVVGFVVALCAVVILWKVFKLALKLVLFVVICVALAGGVGTWLKYGRVSLPIEKSDKGSR